MKTVYVITAFDTRCLSVFKPTVSVFVDEQRCQEVCDEINKDPALRAGYEKTQMNEEGASK